ncbi:hypothetical protein C8A01DRAFT_39486 [Parachaetomium inaequale]|uniref:HCNGP-like protein n=1 Tax=Parachaetomium inaequale TaxID=2588326 RepID=A0AAN6PCW8_9PEZI|nr:hypothetical protein C8A01DRAFT_39486 [Parachaetomium inaequale]
MGLVQYDSSDEDEEVQTPVEPQPPKPALKPPSSDTQNAPKPHPPTATTSSAPPPAATSAPAPSPSPVLGPTLGPPRPPVPTSSTHQEGEEEEEEIDLSFLDSHPQQQGDNQQEEPPRSPNTKTRSLLHNLTLPALPNMDIPPSPPGSPPPGLDALTAKFDTFLRLKKRTPTGQEGVHFNARLAASSGMGNPAVMAKLLAFVGVGVEFGDPSTADGDDDDGGRGVEQYATVLSAGVWDAGCFPAWAYKGPLRRAQERGGKERERARGEAVEFVAASAAAGGGGSAAGSRAGTPGVGGGKRKGRWDT